MYTSVDARLESESDLEVFRLMAADDAIFGIYQYWLHQNPGTHLDGGIHEYGKWQSTWKNLLFFFTQRYDIPCGWVSKIFFSALAAELNGIRG